MKIINIGLSVIFCFTVLLGCTNAPKTTEGTKTTETAANTGLKIAYVNVDSLEAHYELLKKRREDFKKKQEVMESELQQSYQQMQMKGEDMQRKAQTMTQSEIQSAEKQSAVMENYNRPLYEEYPQVRSHLVLARGNVSPGHRRGPLP